MTIVIGIICFVIGCVVGLIPFAGICVELAKLDLRTNRELIPKLRELCERARYGDEYYNLREEIRKHTTALK